MNSQVYVLKIRNALIIQYKFIYVQYVNKIEVNDSCINIITYYKKVNCIQTHFIMLLKFYNKL